MRWLATVSLTQVGATSGDTEAIRDEKYWRYITPMETRSPDFISASIDRPAYLTPSDRILLESKCVEKLKMEVDWANAHVLRSFQLKLVIDGEE